MPNQENKFKYFATDSYKSVTNFQANVDGSKHQITVICKLDYIK